MRTRLQLALAAGIGSGCGAVARWLLALASTGAPDGLPWATLLANVLGSFLIGVIAAFATRENHWLADPAVRQFLMVGCCGGLTTFSIFSLEILVLSLAERPAMALGYALTSIVLWLAAVWLGFGLGRQLAARGGPAAPAD